MKDIILNEDVSVSSKIDGSFGAICKLNGQFHARSKGQQINIENPDKLFKNFIENCKKLDLKDGWFYYGEVLNSPHHNTLTYSRIPLNNFILFNIDRSNQDFLSHNEMVEEGARVGLEVVPLVFEGKLESIQQLESFLDREAYLGGVKEEGLVLKFYKQYGPDKKVLMAKIVREEFKELHKKEWKKTNPTQSDVVQHLIETYKTEARWLKSIYHLRDEGLLTNSPQDIGILLKEIQKDIEKEEKENIKDELWNYFWDKIKRGVISGFPEMYKEYIQKQ